MTLQAIKAEANRLDPQERQELLAHLVALSDRQRRERAERLAAKIDDKDPSHWVSLEELDARLGLNEQQ